MIISKSLPILMLLNQEEADIIANAIAGDMLLIEDELKYLKEHNPDNDEDIKVLFFYASKYEILKQLANKIDILLEDF